VAEGLLLVFVWWLVIQVMGLVAWPLAHRFFKSYPDRGYILSKGLGLILTGFLNWFLVSIRLFRFSIVSICFAIACVATASWFLKTDSIRGLFRFFKDQKKLVLTVEIIFLIAFIAFSLVRMGNPDIAQTEKMPDFAFLTGIVTSDYFPPRDPWFADGTINYFYYGHYLVGLLTKLTGTATEYGYNLGVAAIFAFTWLNAAGVTFGLIKKLRYGILGGFFVALIGNLDCAIQFFSSLGKIMSGDQKLYPFTWFNWWMSSRVIVREGIDVTINEFPFWSYILGDLHAHMNVVPISLLVLAIILEHFRHAAPGLNSLGSGKDKWFRIVITAVVLGAIPCANTWDTPTYFALMIAALLLARQFLPAGQVFSSPEKNSVTVARIIFSPVLEIFEHVRKSSQIEGRKKGWPELLLSWLGIFIVFILTYLLYRPFHANFHPAGTQGLKIVNPVQYTLIGDFLTIYGFFFYCMFPFTLALISQRFIKLNERLKPLAGIAMIILFFALVIAFDRFMIAFCIFFLVFTLAVPLKKEDPEIKEKFFAFALCVMVLIILLGCEFFYIKDAYGRTLERQNTIFKFYYQAWIFCGISAAYGVYWFKVKASRILTLCWEPVYRILLVCVLMFPFVASAVKTGNFHTFTNPAPHAKATLDGIFYMSWQHKGDYEAIKWLRKNATPRQRVLEATGPAFSHYGRISAATGMATILGWGNHQNIWRDGTWKMVGARSAEVKQVYTSNDREMIEEVLDKYKIDYVFYGKLEREQYPGSSHTHFAFMENVLEEMDTDRRLAYLFRYSASEK
jgi:YYY domain-containing protein